MSEQSEQHVTNDSEQRRKRVLTAVSKSVSAYFVMISQDTKAALVSTILRSIDTDKPVSHTQVDSSAKRIFLALTDDDSMYSIQIRDEENQIIMYDNDLDELSPSEVVEKTFRHAQEDEGSKVILTQTKQFEFEDIASDDKAQFVKAQEGVILLLA